MAEQYNVLVWGIGEGYEHILNNIIAEELKGNIKVIALVCMEKDKYCNYKDGYPVICGREISQMKFHYIIVSSWRYFSEIVDEIVALGISREKVIDGRVLTIPHFDFNTYSNLLNNPVSILSDDCWGGLAYNMLSLPFSSPLINIRWKKGEFAKFLRKPEQYLKSELKLGREAELKSGKWPEGILGEEDDAVRLQLIHSKDFQSAKEIWDRRVKRINYNNFFIKMGVSGELDEETELAIEEFKRAPYKKILFLYGNKDIDCCFSTERYIWRQNVSRDGFVEWWDYNQYCQKEAFYDIDMFKLLTAGKDYLRFG